VLLMIFVGIWEYLHVLETELKGGAFSWTAFVLPTEYVLSFASVFIFPVIFYSVLKNKYDLERNIVLYGAGFISCGVILVLSIREIFHNLDVDIIGNYSYFPYIFPLTLWYYSYAALLQDKERKMTLYLSAMTFISFIILIVIETVNYRIPVAGVLLSILGFYLAYCLIYKKGVLTLQGFAWCLFLPAFISFLHTSNFGFVIYVILMMSIEFVFNIIR
jgi:hypothetical protein